MKTNAHTPGPWFVYKSGRTAVFRKLAVAYQPPGEKNGGPGCVEVCEFPGHWPKEDWPEIGANARLIAAAPDLLAAAVDALWLFDQSPSEDLASDATKICRALRSAIAKAKG